MYRHFFKRFIDLIVALVVLLAALPVIIIAGILLMINNKGSIFLYRRVQACMENHLILLNSKQ